MHLPIIIIFLGSSNRQVHLYRYDFRITFNNIPLRSALLGVIGKVITEVSTPVGVSTNYGEWSHEKSSLDSMKTRNTDEVTFVGSGRSAMSSQSMSGKCLLFVHNEDLNNPFLMIFVVFLLSSGRIKVIGKALQTEVGHH